MHRPFCTNKNIISNHGVNVTIFEECHHNINYGKINTWVPDYCKENKYLGFTTKPAFLK